MVAAFITYETHNDIKKIEKIFGISAKNKKTIQKGEQVTDFELDRPVDPSNILWKNMQIKSAEQGVRCFFVILTLACLIYFSFLI